MLYVINNKYYIKVGRKFIPVEITYKNDDIELIPNRKDYIEDNGKVKYTTQTVDKKFKESFKPKKSNYELNRD